MIARGVCGRTTFKIVAAEGQDGWWWSVSAYRPAEPQSRGEIRDGFLYLTGGDLDFGSGGFGVWNGPEPSRDAVVDGALRFVEAFG